MNVWITEKDGARCAGCGDVLKMERDGRCLACAGLDWPSGTHKAQFDWNRV